MICTIRNFPKELRQKWLSKLRHHKVKYVFSGVVENVDEVSHVKGRNPGIKVFAKKSEPENKSSFDNLPTDIKEEEQVVLGEEEDQQPDTDDDEFENVDDTYEGPALLTNLSTTMASSTAQPSYRMVFVREESMDQAHFEGDALPQSMKDAVDFFKG